MRILGGGFLVTFLSIMSLEIFFLFFGIPFFSSLCLMVKSSWTSWMIVTSYLPPFCLLFHQQTCTMIKYWDCIFAIFMIELINGWKSIFTCCSIRSLKGKNIILIFCSVCYCACRWQWLLWWQWRQRWRALLRTLKTRNLFPQPVPQQVHLSEINSK